MKTRWKVLSILGGLLLAASAASAGGDRVTMRDGRVYAGDVLFHNQDSYYVSTSGGVVRLSLSEIERIDFGTPAP